MNRIDLERLRALVQAGLFKSGYCVMASVGGGWIVPKKPLKAGA